MAIERGARKKERCGDVLNALIRNDQDLKNIALALCKPKGGDEGIKAFIGRELRCLHGLGVGAYGRKIPTKIVSGKRQAILHRGIIGSLPQLPQQRNRNAHKHHERRTDRSQHVLTRDNRHCRRRHEQFAMNGQTGRLVGELPCSKPKLAIASVLFFVIGFILSQILFMGEYAFDPDYLTFDIEGILINVIAPLIIAIIGDVLLVGQLKTANEATHADEYCGELDLTEKHDTFSHTETTVVMKDDKDD